MAARGLGTRRLTPDIMIFGREQELGAITSAYEQMLAGRGSVLFLTGEAGLGKTTLVHSWKSGTLENAQRDEGGGLRDEDSGMRAEGRGLRDEEISLSLIPHPSTLFLESACSIPIGNVDVGRLEALQPWIDVADALMRTLPSTVVAPAAKKGGKFDFGKFIIDTAPSWITMIPVLGPSVGAAMEILGAGYDQVYLHRKFASGDPSQNPTAQNQQQVFQQYVNLLTKIAEDVPLVIFLDDLHWADASSVNLLFHLSRQITDKRILVIGTYRSDDALAANDGKGHPIVTVKNEILRYGAGDECSLSFLDEHSIVDILASQIPSITSFEQYVSTPENKRFIAWLQRASDGNSLFVTQFIKTLLEDGWINAAGSFVGDFAAMKIPKSALAVVEERTRRMDDGLKKLLTYATVEGEEFTSYVLERLMRKDAMDFVDELQHATHMGYIVEKGTTRAFANTTTEVFGFSHALLHKALYEQLIDAQRRRLHRSCFDLLKGEWDRRTSTKERTTILATKLITHAEKCEEWDAAAQVAFDAATEFWKSYAEREAQEMFATCIAASDRTGNHELEAQAYEARIAIDIMHSRFDSAMESARRAQELYERIGDVRAIKAMTRQAYILHRTQRSVESEDLSLHVLALSRDRGYVWGQAACLNNLAHVHLSRGEVERALALHVEAYPLCQQSGDAFSIANNLNNRGTVLSRLDRHEEAMACFEEAGRMFAELGDRNLETGVIVNSMDVLLRQRRFREALPRLEQAAERFHELGNLDWELVALGRAEGALLFLGEPARALECLQRMQRIRADMPDPTSSFDLDLNFASVQLALRNLEEAQRHMANVRAGMSQSGRPFVGPFVACLEAMLRELESVSLPAPARREVLREAAEELTRQSQALEDLRNTNNVIYFRKYADLFRSQL